MKTRNLITEAVIIAIIRITITVSLPTEFNSTNHFQEQIVIKNGTIESYKIIPLNLTQSTNETDDDPTTIFTLDDEDVTRNISRTEEPKTTEVTTTDSTTTTEMVWKPNFAQRLLRALLGINDIVIGPINLDVSAESIFRLPVIKQTFGKEGPLNVFNPYAKQIAASSVTSTPKINSNN